VARTHYQPLPAATIRPKQPKNLDSIEGIVADQLDTIVDRMGGGPEGLSVRHGIGVADRRAPYHTARWGPTTLTPRSLRFGRTA